MSKMGGRFDRSFSFLLFAMPLNEFHIQSGAWEDFSASRLPLNDELVTRISVESKVKPRSIVTFVSSAK